MPDDLQGGTYNLWAENEYGMSVTNQLNTAKPQWMSVDSVAPGMTVKVIGKNMSSAAYSTGNKAYVALVGENNVYDLDLASVNEFAIEFVCPEEVVPGEYDIYVSNDRYVWNKPEDEIKLTITDEVSDPYKIDKAWAGNFNYSKTYNVCDYGARPNDGANDTKYFGYALSAMKILGKGILYIPEGTYDITELDIPNGVILAGDGMDKTIINCLGTSRTSHGRPVLMMDEAGYNGIYGLTLHENTGIDSPDEYIIMYGHSFLKDFKLDVPMIPETTITGAGVATGEGRGIGVIIGGEGYNVVDNCKFVGYNAQITHSAPEKYVYIENCELDTTVGCLSSVSSYVVIENCDIVRYADNFPDYLEIERVQGIFTRGPSYISGNTVKNVGSELNDGEVICAENYMGGVCLAGEVLSATENQVTVKTFDDIETASWNWDLSAPGFNRYYLVITAGRGAGQYSPITAYSEADGSITIERPFDVLPNKDSVFAVMPLSENVTMYKNSAEHAKKGFWLYYDCVDSVIADNRGIDTEGALIRSVYAEQYVTIDGEQVPQYANTVCFFNRIDGNYFEGSSPITNVLGVSAEVAIHGTNPRNMNIYGVEIKDNTIIGDKNAGAMLDSTEAPMINGISVAYFCDRANTAEYSVLKQVIIDNNFVKNSDSGITLTYHDGREYRKFADADMTSEIIVGNNNVFENTDIQINNELEEKFGHTIFRAN